MRTAVAKTPVDLVLALVPQELVEPNFQRWREHAQQQELTGLGNLDLSIFYRFCAILLKMGLGGLRRRELYFDEATVSAMSQRTFENLLFTIRDAGFQPYPDGQPLPDGRTAHANGPLRSVPRFVDELQAHWQDVCSPGAILAADETVVGWKGTTNVHITTITNNQRP
jgi:hypothetical protein